MQIEKSSMGLAIGGEWYTRGFLRGLSVRGSSNRLWGGHSCCCRSIGLQFSRPCSVAADEVRSSKIALGFRVLGFLGLLGGKFMSSLMSSTGSEICGDVGLVGGKVEYALFVFGIILHYRFG